MRYLMIVCAVALAACLGLAEAAVEVIKVGGDIQIRGIAREDWFGYDPTGPVAIPIRPITTPVPDESWLDSTIRLQVEAELTDDVGAVVRLINERDWAGVGGADDADDATDIGLDLGYITLDNMFGYPVKATLGRQEIRFGEGFLIGDGYNASLAGVGDTPYWVGSCWVWDEGQSVPAYGKSVRRAFDALRATYSVEPYTVDLFATKIDDRETGDADISGLNIHYNYLDMATFDLGYFVGKDRRVGNKRDTRTISLRGEGDILIAGAPGLTVKGEYAWQRGDRRVGAAVQDTEASAWYLGAEYAFQDVLYEPSFGVTYISMSGDEIGTTADWEQFDPLVEDKEFGVIGELTGLTRTNLKAWRLGGGLKPMEALSLDVAYYLFERDETAAGVSDELGDEINVTLTYDYTEDVQFGLQAAWFSPDAYLVSRTATANQIVGSVKVSF